MGWLEESLNVLGNRFNKDPFSAAEAAEVLKGEKGYSKNTVYRILHLFNKEGSLIRLGRGVYQLPDHRGAGDLWAGFEVGGRVPVEIDSASLMKGVEILEEGGIEFMVTGPSSLSRFHHYLSRRYIHLIYVIQGGGEYAVKSLREGGFIALLNPDGRMVENILETIDDGDLFIIREFSELKGNINGRASLERALVDTYFEATRNRIPFSEVEVGRIIGNVFREEAIDVTRLLHLASRRGIREELAVVVKTMIPDYPVDTGYKGKKVTTVLQGVRE
jgi:hypothetical protein